MRILERNSDKTFKRPQQSQPYGFAFVTNQELRLAERDELEAISGGANKVELYHLERVAAILDQPALASIWKQFLDIDYSSGPKGGRPSAEAVNLGRVRVPPLRAARQAPLRAAKQEACTYSAPERNGGGAARGAGPRLQCAFVDESGNRCSETRFLELHHKLAHALDGNAVAPNLAMFCRAHNAHAAEQDFGREFMRERVGQARASRAVERPPPER